MKLEALFSLRSALIVCGSILLVTFLYPLSGDNALYMYMADLLLKGHLPYIGSWDVNFPGIVFLHALHVLPFGGSVTAFHSFDVLLQLAGCVAIYKLTVTSGGNSAAAFFATVTATLYYVAGGLGLCGERDVYIALLLIGALNLIIRGRQYDLYSSALLLGVALIMRPTVLAYIGILTLWLFAARPDSRWSSSLRFLFISLVPLGLFCLWYLTLGHLDTFFEATLFYNTSVYARISMGVDDLRYLATFWPILIASPVGVWYALTRSKFSGIPTILSIIAAIITLVPVYRFPYHFHPIMILLIIVSVIGWQKVFAYIYFRSNRAMVSALIAVLVCYSVFTIVRSTHLVTATRGYLASGSVDATRNSFSSNQAWGTIVQDSITAYLTAEVRPEDKVQFLTGSMHLPLNAEVEPASRFTSIYNLIWRSAKTNDLVPMQHIWREEFIRDVREARFIISSRVLPDHVFNNGYLPVEVLSSYPELEGLLTTGYDSVRQFGGYTIYRHKSREGAVAPSR